MMKLVERPVICLRQDKAIFKRYILTKNMWTHKGKCWIVPKDKGFEIMVLSFQSQYLFLGTHKKFHISKPLMNILLSTLNMLIDMHQLPHWGIITRNPSTRGEILSTKILKSTRVTDSEIGISNP